MYLGFGSELWLIPFVIMWSKSRLDIWMFVIYFPNYEKLKSFVETFTLYNQLLIFEEQLCISNIDIIFDSDQTEINNADIYIYNTYCLHVYSSRTWK